MEKRRMALALSALLVAALACNLPRTPPAGPSAAGSPTPTVTPYVPQQEETQAPSPVAEPPTATPASTATPTLTPTPRSSPTPRPTPTPVSAGPLDFPMPIPEDVTWQLREDGQYTVTLVIHIEGGMPPFTVHHDLDTFETSEREYPIVFVAAGCSALVHTITVESADGQSVAHPYWIPAPWCVTPNP